jgi:MFS family permease
VASWRWIFLINVPVGVAVVLVGRAHIPETRDPDATGRLDWPGAVLGALALTALTLGLSEQQWLIAFAGIVLIGAFVLVERHRRDPLVPLAVFRSRTYSGTNVVTLLLYGALAVTFFMLGLVLQGPLGYSPLQAGVATVPITIVMLALSARAGALAERIGPRIQMTVGPALVAVGMLLLTGISAESGYVTEILPGIVVFGLGLATTVAPLTATALGSVEDHHAGVASGINNAVARTGSLLAIASVPVIAGFVPGEIVGADELLDGFDRVLRAGAVIAAVAAVVSWLTVRRPTLEVVACYHCAAGGPPPPSPPLTAGAGGSRAA